MMSVPTMAARAVAVKTASVGMPWSARALKIPGFTAKMYAMVRNVVMPAMISVRMLVVLGSNPNTFLSIVHVLGYTKLI